MRPPEKRKPGGGTPGSENVALVMVDASEDSLSRPAAQRRLAMKIAASAGLSLAVAGVVVVLALGDGGAR